MGTLWRYFSKPPQRRQSPDPRPLWLLGGTPPVLGHELVSRRTEQRQKYRGMLETQKSGNKTSPGEIGLNIRTLASPKVGQDQVSGEESVPCQQEHSILWRMSLYILIYCFYHLRCLCNGFYGICALVDCLSLGLYKEDYLQFFKCVSFWLHSFSISGKVGIPYTRLTTPVERLLLPMLTVLNRCVIEFLVAFLCCHFAFWDFQWM